MSDLPQILLIDDNRQDLDLVQEACADSGLAAIFHLARSSKEALEAIDRLTLQGVALDLIVLDLFVPEKEGFEVLEHLQARAPLAAIPVLVLTGSSRMEDVDRSFRLGADGFLWKPTVYDDYRVVAERMAELLQSPAGPTRPSPTLADRQELMWGLQSPGRWAGQSG